ncbi:hypothetical protein [Alteromonas sp. a30]|uniref:hypothetical protein n=1 Tax=Alteromonas sp. a30 TaxID=2730917 RepID=UPI002281026C|nr:hypothetical protein [Alteromonas sp. a30]MCY7296121.1 hypothetical protein [Alteromonas sp. a30]
MRIVLAIGFLCLNFSALADTATKVDIHLVKTAAEKWQLSYLLSAPAKRLAFVRNPDNSRTIRWQPMSSAFHIIQQDGNEFIVRKDSEPFSDVSVLLTPTYKHLSKDYAPFSPYSNKGALIHTGRLFACANACADDENHWKISMQAPKGQHMVVHGVIHTEVVHWVDKDDGINVYVGTQKPIETDNVIAIVDESLPEKINTSLEADIPALMDYFEQRLGKLKGSKPMLFASYANVDGHSSQGGTLPNQIFMHWNVNNLNEKVADEQFLNNTLWFFAHEVAHLYQRSNGNQLYGEQNESWLHEGNAEWLAALALLEMYPDTKPYVEARVNKAKQICNQGLRQFPLTEAANNGRFDLYYQCGLLIHKTLDEAIKQNSEGKQDIFSLWRAYRDALNSSVGEPNKGALFLRLAEQKTSADLISKIKAFINAKANADANNLKEKV